MDALRSFPELSPLFLMLFFLQIFGAKGTYLEVLQTPGPISVLMGDTLTLNCTLKGLSLPGGVRWYKGLDRNQQPICSDKASQNSARVMRIIPGALEDFSIRIRNIQPEDAGTYYCVKFRAGTPEREYKSGNGTVVSVRAFSKLILEMEPATPVHSDNSEMLTCIVEGTFKPHNIRLVWLVNWQETPLEASVSTIHNSEGTSNLKNSLEVMVTKWSKQSVFTCQVVHNSQPIYNVSVSSAILTVLDPAEGRGVASSSETDQRLWSSTSLWIGLVLGKIIAVSFLLCLLLEKAFCKRSLRHTPVR